MNHRNNAFLSTLVYQGSIGEAGKILEMSSEKGYLLSRNIFVAIILLCTIGARGMKNVRRDDKDSKEYSKDDSSPMPYSLEDIYKGKFQMESFHGEWISPNELFYLNYTEFALAVYNVDTREIQSFGRKKFPGMGRGFGLSVSADRSYILLVRQYQNGYRHSSSGKYHVYNFKTGTVEKIADGNRSSLVEWSPVGHSMIYENGNDLYYRRVDENGTVAIRRLTNDGLEGTILNGVLDWVYEVVVIEAGKAVWFSRDGNYLAFISLNETLVHPASYFIYGKPGGLAYQYPEEVKLKFPKVGTENPQVSLKLVDLKDPASKVLTLTPPIDVVGKDHILYRVDWITDKSLVAVWTNRVTNIAQIVLYDIDGKWNYLLKMEEKGGWLQIPERIYFHENKFFFEKLQETHTKDGRYLHLTSFDYVNGALTNETDLTPCRSGVQKIIKIDAKNRKIYYLAAAPNKPSQRNLYSVDIDGKTKPKCISCSLLTPEGNKCTYVSAEFSTDATRYALACLGPDPITVGIYDSEHNKILDWEKNEKVREELKKRLSFTSKTVKIRVNGFCSRVKMFLPPGFNESHKYPMIVNVYGAPDTVSVTDDLVLSPDGQSHYNSPFHNYYVTNRSVIWTLIDGRGSAHKGSKMLFEIYKRAGGVEVEDQIAVTKKLQEMYSWIDANRTGIWGESYGGYATAMVLATDKENIFKCGISNSLVASLIYHVSIYVESFMGLPTPEDNLSGYNRSDVTRLAEGMRGKKFLLIHGTADENAQYQNAMLLTKSLVNADIQFEQITYPDEGHDLGGVQSHHAYAMDHFWAQCLNFSNY